MEKGRIGLLATRAFQFICAAVVLGVSVKLVTALNRFLELCKAVHDKDKECTASVEFYPTTLKFAAFVGAFGLLDALVGLIAAFLSAIPWVAVLGLDALAAIFFLAGGINSAVKRAGDERKTCHWDSMSGFCGRFDTTTAFMFLGFLSTLGAMAMVFFSRRSSNKHSAV